MATRIPNQPRIAATRTLAAMGAYRLGQMETAANELKQARGLLAGPYENSYTPRGEGNGHWADWAIARLLEREAAALIEGTKGH